MEVFLVFIIKEHNKTAAVEIWCVSVWQGSSGGARAKTGAEPCQIDP
jgi:hypothetical protein